MTLAEVTDHKAPRYVVFFTPLLLHPSQARVSSWASYSRTLPATISFKIYLIVPSIYAEVFQMTSFPQVFPRKSCIRISCRHICNMPQLSHSLLLDILNAVWWELQIMKFFIVQCPPSLVTSFILGQNCFFSTLFSHTFSLILCTVHLLLFCTMTNKCTITSQIITLLQVSTLLCHPQGVF